MDRVSGLSSAKSASLDTGTWDLTTRKIIYYNWSIKNFSSWSQSTSECLESPVFPANDSPQWRLQIYLGGDKEESKDFVFLNLRLVSSQSQEPDAKVKFAFVDCRGQMTNRGSCTHYYKTKKGWVYSTCVRRSLLLTNEFDLSSKDSLTVACEVTVQAQTCSQRQEPELVTPELQLAKDLSCLLETNPFSDVTIFVQESQFQSHKVILSARSPVFAAMFQNETKENQTNAVDIPDVDRETFGALLRFIDTGHVDNLEEVAEELFVAADKYQFAQLKMMCEEQMYRKLSTENAPKFLVLADLHTAHHLKDQCIEFINRNSSDVVKTESWEAMVETHPHLAAEIYVRLVGM